MTKELLADQGFSGRIWKHEDGTISFEKEMEEVFYSEDGSFKSVEFISLKDSHIHKLTVVDEMKNWTEGLSYFYHINKDQKLDLIDNELKHFVKEQEERFSEYHAMIGNMGYDEQKDFYEKEFQFKMKAFQNKAEDIVFKEVQDFFVTDKAPEARKVVLNTQVND